MFLGIRDVRTTVTYLLYSLGAEVASRLAERIGPDD